MMGGKSISLNMFGLRSGRERSTEPHVSQRSRSQGFASAPDLLNRSFLVKATDFGDEVMAWPPEQGMHPS